MRFHGRIPRGERARLFLKEKLKIYIYIFIYLSVTIARKDAEIASQLQLI